MNFFLTWIWTLFIADVIYDAVRLMEKTIKKNIITYMFLQAFMKLHHSENSMPTFNRCNLNFI